MGKRTPIRLAETTPPERQVPRAAARGAVPRGPRTTRVPAIARRGTVSLPPGADPGTAPERPGGAPDPLPGASAGGSLSGEAYRRIKDAIVTCQLAPGSTFSESSIAERFGLGKAPVRWALATLVQEQLVVARPRQGYVVAPVTIQRVNELFDLRLLLEPAATRMAAGNVDGALLRQIDAICAAGYQPGDRASERTFLGANKSFHVSVARASGNRSLARVLESILEEMERLFHLGLALRDRSEEMQHEHNELICMLVAGDKAGAERVTVAQIEAARKMVLDAILGSVRVRTVEITTDRG
jgi:DNA-binding GntR family transcriptional regulator